MDFKTRTVDRLRGQATSLVNNRVVAGFDGFVDTIVTPVGMRHGQGKDFAPIETIPAFGNRILAAAGKSTNIELYPQLQKLGGNGPIMGNAILAAGAKLTYVGALGKAQVHPALASFAGRCDTAISLCDPGLTTAVEFKDGKIMLGMMTSLDEITYEAVTAKCGGEPGFIQMLESARLIALLNWTMIPNMTDIWNQMTEKLLPKLSTGDRNFFFDLADPEKRSAPDLTAALKAISNFQPFGRVTLGLNLKEAQHVHSLLNFSASSEDESALRTMAEQIRVRLGLHTVVIHPRESAACATAEGSFWVPGPYCEAPLITTGAGDHFNAGFVIGQLLGFDPECCLTVGVATSGHYVRAGNSPTFSDLEQLLTSWK